MAWISQGLEKVVPQPELKGKELTAAEQQVQVRSCFPSPFWMTTLQVISFISSAGSSRNMLLPSIMNKV